MKYESKQYYAVFFYSSSSYLRSYVLGQSPGLSLDLGFGLFL